MEQTKPKKNKIEVEELMKFPQQVERELEYWIKEKKVSYIERAIKANDMNTRFAGTYSLETMGCSHPDDEDVLDALLEDDPELIENFEENVDFEDEDELAEAG